MVDNLDMDELLNLEVDVKPIKKKSPRPKQVKKEAVVARQSDCAVLLPKPEISTKIPDMSQEIQLLTKGLKELSSLVCQLKSDILDLKREAKGTTMDDHFGTGAAITIDGGGFCGKNVVNKSAEEINVINNTIVDANMKKLITY